MFKLPDPSHFWLLKYEPRPVQVEAVYRSMFGIKTRDHVDEDVRPIVLRPQEPAVGWGHWMQMRLGKTAVAINEFEIMRRHYDLENMIVFAPNSFKEGWVRELEATLPRPDEVPIHVHSANKQHTFRFLEKHKGILIINYEAIRQPDMENALSVCARGGMVIADESISIKGFNSMTTRSALKIGKEARFVRALTGKPVVQGPQDLWSQFRFVRELNGVNFYAFRNKYCRMGGYMGKKIVGYNEERKADLWALRDKAAFRARRINWMTTPGVEYSIQPLQVDGEQLRYYKTLQNEMYMEIEDATVTAQMVLIKLNKLQQISSGFVFDDEREVKWLVKPESNPKLRWLKDKLENEIESKVVVVCLFRPSIDLLKEQLAEYGVRWIHGEQEDIEQHKDIFNNDPTCRVMLVQIRAGKYGHNLMGSKTDPCSTMIFYETSYSLDDRAQIEERPQGAGQVETLSIIDLVVTPSDMKPIKALQDKEDVAAALMGYDRKTGILPHSE